MPEQTQGQILINVRHAVRGMITLALADDMPSAVRHAQDLAKQPHVAAQAMLELGELLDLALHSWAGRSGMPASEVGVLWRRLCAQHAEYDQATADALDQ